MEEMQLTPRQFEFAVDFWTEKFRVMKRPTDHKWSATEEQIKKFRLGLIKAIKNETGIRAISCHRAPQEVLRAALAEVDKTKTNTGLDVEPPWLVCDVDMIFNPDGTIHLREESPEFVELEP
jgi:hypothetical protein